MNSITILIHRTYGTTNQTQYKVYEHKVHQNIQIYQDHNKDINPPLLFSKLPPKLGARLNKPIRIQENLNILENSEY